MKKICSLRRKMLEFNARLMFVQIFGFGFCMRFVVIICYETV